jgi:methylaspartate mutase sigma subunit
VSGSQGVGVHRHQRGIRDASGRPVIVTSVASDSHTWNLVFLQLLIEELGFDVVNLGACVPDELLLLECRVRLPAMVVVSSVNGHGYQDGLRVIRLLRAHPELRNIPMVIGGKLGISGGESAGHIDDLLAAGFDAVFDDRADGPASFRKFVADISGVGENPRLPVGSGEVSP